MESSLDITRIKDEIFLAIEAEKQAVRQKLGVLGELLEVDLIQGKNIVTEPGAYVYSFGCDLETPLAEGIEVQVQTPGMSAAGEILDHDIDQGIIRMVLRQNIGRSPPEAVMGFDSSFLLDLLKNRVEQITDHAHTRTELLRSPIAFQNNLELGMDLLLGTRAPCNPKRLEREGLSESQKRSVAFALGQSVAYIWGPPGTGKTRTVAHLVCELVERSERIMLCAHTNTATDNALLQTIGIKSWEPGSIVRVGFCSEPVLKAGVGVDTLVDRMLRQDYVETVRDIERLCREVERLHDDPPEVLVAKSALVGRKLRIARDLIGNVGDGHLAELKRQLADVCKTINDLEIELLTNTSVIATTLTQLYTNRLLGKIMCDVMIIDEAGVASLATSLVAGCKARKRVFAVGDFMQLPAIVQSDDKFARNWLGRSVFESAGCEQPDKEHPLRTMLYEQWRMHPDISEIVSSMFYAGKLKDVPVIAEKVCNSPSLLLLDTSLAGARSQSTKTGSKINRHHSELIARLIDWTPSYEVAVIAPYRAQVRKLREAVRQKSALALASGRVEVFTVHRFQGRDKQMVFLDLVEAPGTLCTFLNEIRNPAAGRLINVAMSRAKEKLVLIANLEHLHRSLGRDALVNRVIAQVRMIGGLELEAGRDEDMARCSAFLRGEP